MPNDLIKKANKQVKAVNESAARLGLDSDVSTLTPLNSPINTKSLTAQPDFVIPDRPVVTNGMSTAETYVQGAGDTLISQLKGKVEADRTAAENKYTNSLDQYVESLQNQTGFSGFLAGEEERRGIENLANEVGRLEGEINTERLARAEFKNRLETQGGGLKSGANAEYNNFARDSLFRETNSIIQLGVQSGRLSNAQAAAERVAKAYYEQEQADLNARKELMTANKELFTTAEAREFNINFEQAKRELDRQEEELRLLQNTKIEALKMAQLNGAPSEVTAAISGAESPEDVIRSGGQYGVADLLQREQLRASIASSWASTELSNLQVKSEKAAQDRINQAIANGEIVLDKDQQDLAFKIGKEYETESSEFKKQIGAYNRIIASAEDPSAAGDLALIFNYMKMLDPGSTVREGEFATAQNSAGVPEQVLARYNKVLSGERLSETTRDDFVDRSDKLYEASLQQQMELEDRYRDKAINLFGLPEPAADKIIQDLRATGSYSDVAFGLKIDSLSTDQYAELQASGLLP